MRYGNAYTTEKRKAHGAVVQMVLSRKKGSEGKKMLPPNVGICGDLKGVFRLPKSILSPLD
jgi:hypothetical protein